RAGILHLLNHGVRKLRGSVFAAHVTSEFVACLIHALKSVAGSVGRVGLSNVVQHQQSRAQNGRRIGDVLPGDVGCGTVYGLKDGALVAEVRSRHKTESTDEASAEIGDDISI